ncbi:hypothetical protein UCRNP2_1682 [Neofusicoccum parvum UCRNP2]|uniref:Uncharacterized protein n=1 Tax=Botryosphaeria parva (strain UCR-NP2) TaxID=1287680 RepID=R1GTG2_BOTPV|nr:hypothetical protein UCRNP2_1682 [Neofusicoccum parvum UCRNP2]
MEPLQERESTPPTKNSDALEETDITPTTTKRPVDHKDAVDPMHDPMGALAAAGAAIGESLKSAVAPGQRSPAKSEPESWEGSIASDDDQPKVEEEKKDRAVGDVYLRPLQLDRTASSVASSSGPPSPQRDGDREDYSPVKAPPPLRASRSPSIQPPELDTSGTAQAAPDDYSPGPDTSDLATDRLTADIMKRLSTPSLVGSVPDLNRTLTPQPPAQDTPKASQETRASAVVPSEYENYWAASGEEDVGGGSGHSAQPRIPLFREILALKSTDERLAKYSQTREQFAGMDTGLRNWVQSTLATKPEHAELANLPRQPLPPIQSSHSSSGGGLVLNMRHKHNASISHFATGFRKTNQTAAGLESSSAAHASTASPTDAGQQGGAGRGGMQVKGKDLLKGAGVLGGKGMKEAKGLFAKGRSRFRGESKVD